MGGESEDPIQRCFDASYRRLVGQLYGVCGDLSEAEDVVAEAFAKAVSRRRAFERLDNPEAWLRTVAANVARSRHRRRVVGERLLGRTAQPDAVHQPDLSDDRMQVVAALRTLPDHATYHWSDDGGATWQNAAFDAGELGSPEVVPTAAGGDHVIIVRGRRRAAVVRRPVGRRRWSAPRVGPLPLGRRPARPDHQREPGGHRRPGADARRRGRHPCGGPTLAVAVDNRLFRSTDGGGTWEELAAR